MTSSSFFTALLAYVRAHVPKMPETETFAFMIEHSPDGELDGGMVIEVLEMIAPRFRCGLTKKFSPDHSRLLEETQTTLMRFIDAHAQHCKTCTREKAATFVFGRMINTIFSRVAFGCIPAFLSNFSPYFFRQSDTGDYLKALPSDHLLDTNGLVSILSITRPTNRTSYN